MAEKNEKVNRYIMITGAGNRKKAWMISLMIMNRISRASFLTLFFSSGFI